MIFGYEIVHQVSCALAENKERKKADDLDLQLGLKQNKKGNAKRPLVLKMTRL